MSKLLDQISIETINEKRLNGVCYQDVRRYGRGESRHHSTSFFISKNFLLTSAHNVTKLILGRNKPKELTLFPSRLGDNFPMDKVVLKVDYDRNIRIAPNYSFINKRSYISHDIALIYLPGDLVAMNPKLEGIPFLPLLSNITTLVEGEKIFCAGYPASEEYAGTFHMTLDESTLLKVHKNSFNHKLDTRTGNSGSPILVLRDGIYHVIGINSIKYNGTLLNNNKLAWIEKSMKEMKDE